jgi:hypothetical protein
MQACWPFTQRSLNIWNTYLTTKKSQHMKHLSDHNHVNMCCMHTVLHFAWNIFDRLNISRFLNRSDWQYTILSWNIVKEILYHHSPNSIQCWLFNSNYSVMMFQHQRLCSRNSIALEQWGCCTVQTDTRRMYI